MYKIFLSCALLVSISPLCASQPSDTHHNVKRTSTMAMDENLDARTSLIEACLTNGIQARDVEGGIQIQYKHFHNANVVYDIPLERARAIMQAVHNATHWTLAWYEQDQRIGTFHMLPAAEKLSCLQSENADMQKEMHYTLSLLRWQSFVGCEPNEFGDEKNDYALNEKKVLKKVDKILHDAQERRAVVEDNPFFASSTDLKKDMYEYLKKSHEIARNRLKWRQILNRSTAAQEINRGAQLPVLLPGEQRVDTLMRMKEVIVQQLREKIEPEQDEHDLESEVAD